MKAGNDKQFELRADGKVFKVMFSFVMMMKYGPCRLCGDGKTRELFWSFVEIEQILNETGEPVSTSGRLATLARREITKISRANLRGCAEHYREEFVAAEHAA